MCINIFQAKIFGIKKKLYQNARRYKKMRSPIPLTFCFAKYLATATLFSARYVCVLACWSATECVASILFLFLILDTVLPFLYPRLILLRSHEKFMASRVYVWTESPKLLTTFPILNGVMWGTTENS